MLIHEERKDDKSRKKLNGEKSWKEENLQMKDLYKSIIAFKTEAELLNYI